MSKLFEPSSALPPSSPKTLLGVDGHGDQTLLRNRKSSANTNIKPNMNIDTETEETSTSASTTATESTETIQPMGMSGNVQKEEKVDAEGEIEGEVMWGKVPDGTGELDLNKRAAGHASSRRRNGYIARRYHFIQNLSLFLLIKQTPPLFPPPPLQSSESPPRMTSSTPCSALSSPHN